MLSEIKHMGKEEHRTESNLRKELKKVKKIKYSLIRLAKEYEQAANINDKKSEEKMMRQRKLPKERRKEEKNHEEMINKLDKEALEIINEIHKDEKINKKIEHEIKEVIVEINGFIQEATTTYNQTKNKALNYPIKIANNHKNQIEHIYENFEEIETKFENEMYDLKKFVNKSRNLTVLPTLIHKILIETIKLIDIIEGRLKQIRNTFKDLSVAMPELRKLIKDVKQDYEAELKKAS